MVWTYAPGLLDEEHGAEAGSMRKRGVLVGAWGELGARAGHLPKG